MRGHHDVHVVRGGDRWRVRQGGRTLSRHYTQATAVKVARRTAKRDCVELTTHGRDGRIRSKESYGREGRTRDTER